MQKAYLISTGTELLMGTTTYTNSVFLAQKLEEIGIRVIGKSTVGDNEESIINAFESGIKMADIVISTGGLGPTNDDLTKQVACKVMNCQLELINEELEKLKE
ncbi:MAG: competence/damage-inducible protein A, partial [Syntrophomonadaceae bacterium]|nr:competence/damage-inducible protein A [Syntrophomonadaceae bacterium]